MLDRGEFWSAPAAPDAMLTAPGLQIRLLPALPQIMLSGDLEAGLARFGLTESLGLLGKATGARYALRLARGRVLIVGEGCENAPAGWHEGVATTPMTGALAVLEITGPQADELLARATAIDLRKASPCAALNFAGVTSVLSRHEGAYRLHFDRGLTTYLLDWCRSCGLF